MSDQLAVMVDAAMHARGLNPYQLSHDLGRPGGKVFSAKQLDRLIKGLRRIRSDDAPVVQRIVDVLDPDDLKAQGLTGFDAADMWEAAGLWPPDLKVETYRTFAVAVGSAASTAEQPGPFTSRTTGYAGERLRPAGRRAARLPLVSHGLAPIGR